MTNFRYDINGLRAIAVFSVLVFHFNRSVLPGGFIGVDVFFVISGFLMNSIIFRGIKNNNFSILKFYLARARRIVPALLYTILTVLLIGLFILDPISYQALGKHSKDSLLFISNITYFQESGYFDAESYKKILLHTWSLSVEWQFYLFYPVTLVLASKIANIKTIKILIVIITILSIVLCNYLVRKEPISTYFLLHTRMWEMLIGGIAFLFPLNVRSKKIVEIVGVSLIVFSCFYIDENTRWPSYYTLLPTLGTYLVIITNNEESILSVRPIQKLGLWSYSIYLMHWPIISLTKILHVNNYFYIYLPTVIVLSFLSYEFIEKRRSYKWGLIGVFTAALIFSIYVSQNGISSRVPEKYRLTKTEYHGRYYGGAGIPSDGSLINLNPSAKTKIIVAGDSMARQYINSLLKKNLNIYSITQDGCLSTKNYYSDYRPTQTCPEVYDILTRAIKENKDIKLIIYAQAWDDHHYKDYVVQKISQTLVHQPDFSLIVNDLTDLINNLSPEQTLIILGRPQGTSASFYECMTRNNIYINPLPRQCGTLDKRKPLSANEQLKQLSKKYENVLYVDPNDALCENDLCPIKTKDGHPIYSDASHLSIYGADIVIRALKGELKK